MRGDDEDGVELAAEARRGTARQSGSLGGDGQAARRELDGDRLDAAADGSHRATTCVSSRGSIVRQVVAGHQPDADDPDADGWGGGHRPNLAGRAGPRDGRAGPHRPRQAGILTVRVRPLEETSHGRRPGTSQGRHHRRRHRRQQPVLAPGEPRLARHRAASTRAPAEPGRLHRPRVQLHLPDRPLEGDDRAHARQRPPVQGARRLHRERRHRGRADARADGGAEAPDDVGDVVGHRDRAARRRTRSRRSCRTSTRRSSSAASRRRASASSTRCEPARSCASGARHSAR